MSHKKLTLESPIAAFPLIEFKSVLFKMETGEVLEVVVKEEGLKEDLLRIIGPSRHKIIRMEKKKEAYHLLIRKG